MFVMFLDLIEIILFVIIELLNLAYFSSEIDKKYGIEQKETLTY